MGSVVLVSYLKINPKTKCLFPFLISIFTQRTNGVSHLLIKNINHKGTQSRNPVSRTTKTSLSFFLTSFFKVNTALLLAKVNCIPVWLTIKQHFSAHSSPLLLLHS